MYSVPPCRINPALQEGNYDFPQPLKHKQEGIYDVPPPALTKPALSPQSHYDFPPNVEPAAHHQHQNANSNEGIYDVPPPALLSGAGSQKDIYDIPRCKLPSQHKPLPLRQGREQGHLRHARSGCSSSRRRDGRREPSVVLQHGQHAQQHVHVLVLHGLRLWGTPHSGRGRGCPEVVPPAPGRGGFSLGAAYNGSFPPLEDVSLHGAAR